MELQEVGKIIINPFAFERILELEIIKEINEHARLAVRGVLKEGEEDSLVSQAWDETAIELVQDGKTLFCGVATDIEVICESGVYYLEAKAVSWTIMMDREEKKRSFQEKGLDYINIVNQLAGEAGGLAKCAAPEKQVKNLLLQYRETNWDFLKRIASHSNSVLIADATSHIPSFSFGLGTGNSYGEDISNTGDFLIRKKVSQYRKMSQSKEISYQEQDAVECTIQTDYASMEIGDQINIKGNSLYIREVTIRLKGSVLRCYCTATTKQGISASNACHPYVSGLTLDGKVLKAENDTIKVHLSIDDSQDESKAYPFPYATGYSAEGHTGWYVMPEIGDTVQIIFPTEDENSAYAVQSIRQQNTEKTSDPRVKYLRTPDGKEIKLDKDEILITSNDGITFIRINENTGVDIYTDKEVRVISDGSLTVTSGEKISMSSTDDFNICAGKNLTVTAKDSITMACDKNVLEMLPGNGTALSAAKPIKVFGEDTIDIISKGKFISSSNDAMEISASKDFVASSGKKLSLTASGSLVGSCKASSIKMDGNINMKATLIKEN